MKRFKFLIIIVILLLLITGEPAEIATAGGFSCSSQTQIPLAECEALDDLFNSTNGASWTNHTNWYSMTPCSWYGVTCTAGKLYYHVSAIALQANNLDGYLPNSLGDLSYLTNLNIYGNNLTGRVPSTIGNLSNLTNLYLHNNDLSGALPSNFTNLSVLDIFHFDNTSLCEPKYKAFQSWLDGIFKVYSDDVLCLGSPVLISPTNLSVVGDSTPRLTWGAVASAGRYKIQISANSSFSPVIEQKVVGAASTSTVISELSNGTYYWRASTGQLINGIWVYPYWSSTWSFEVDVLDTPIPIKPVDWYIMSDGNPRLKWSEVAGATRHKVRVYAADMTTVLEQKVVGDKISTVMSYLPNNFYYWKVAAGRQVGGIWTYYEWSDLEGFAILDLGAPTLISPAHNSYTPDHTPRLNWTDVLSAEQYRIRVTDNKGALVKFVRVGDKETTVLTYLPDGTYFWKVSAGHYHNGQWNWYDWSSEWKFTVMTFIP